MEKERRCEDLLHELEGELGTEIFTLIFNFLAATDFLLPPTGGLEESPSGKSDARRLSPAGC